MWHASKLAGWIAFAAQMQFKIHVNCGSGDNPAQSEVCSHIGGNGNQLCRKCHAGETHEVQQSNEGFIVSLRWKSSHCLSFLSFLVLTRLKYPAWQCSFCWRNCLGCRVPDPIGLSGCRSACAKPADDWYQRCLHTILDWLLDKSSTNIAQGTPWMAYSWYSERTAHLGSGA